MTVVVFTMSFVMFPLKPSTFHDSYCIFTINCFIFIDIVWLYNFCCHYVYNDS